MNHTEKNQNLNRLKYASAKSYSIEAIILFLFYNLLKKNKEKITKCLSLNF
jgi:hypothetical protein